MRPTRGFSGQFNYLVPRLGHLLQQLPGTIRREHAGQLRYQPSPLLPGSSYGNSDYDVRHNFNLNYMYETPSNWSKPILKYVLGGWRLGGTLFYHTGLPWSPVDLASRSESGNVTGLRNATPLATFAALQSERLAEKALPWLGRELAERPAWMQPVSQ